MAEEDKARHEGMGHGAWGTRAWGMGHGARGHGMFPTLKKLNQKTQIIIAIAGIPFEIWLS